MKDRFKFRFWFKDTQEMIYSEKFNDVQTLGQWLFEDRKDVVKMQCTGIKDKNCKLIYEGDIVRLFCDEFENIHTVKFGDFAMYSLDFQTEYEKGSTAVYGYYLGGLKYPMPLSISLDTSGMQIEVIGNIYQDKELLNGQYV